MDEKPTDFDCAVLVFFWAKTFALKNIREALSEGGRDFHLAFKLAFTIRVSYMPQPAENLPRHTHNLTFVQMHSRKHVYK